MKSLDLLKKYSKVKGDVHFFAGNLDDAKAFLDFGFTLSLFCLWFNNFLMQVVQ